MTAQETLEGHPSSPPKSVATHGGDGICGTGGVKPAKRREKRGDEGLIATNDRRVEPHATLQ